MGCRGCGGPKNNIQVKVVEKITIDKMKLTEEIEVFMKAVLDEGGAMGRVSQPNIFKMIELYNKFFGENRTAHLKRDIDEVYSNMKALYHRIRRNEIVFEEPEPIVEIVEDEIEVVEEQTKEEKVCIKCAKKLPWNSKKTTCKDCQEKE